MPPPRSTPGRPHVVPSSRGFHLAPFAGLGAVATRLRPSVPHRPSGIPITAALAWDPDINAAATPVCGIRYLVLLIFSFFLGGNKA